MRVLTKSSIRKRKDWATKGLIRWLVEFLALIIVVSDPHPLYL